MGIIQNIRGFSMCEASTSKLAQTQQTSQSAQPISYYAVSSSDIAKLQSIISSIPEILDVGVSNDNNTIIAVRTGAQLPSTAGTGVNLTKIDDKSLSGAVNQQGIFKISKPVS